MHRKYYSLTFVFSKKNLAFIFSRHQIEELHRKVKKEVGDVSIVINNAGVLYCRPFLQHSAPQIENLIQTNLMGKAKYRSLEIRGEKAAPSQPSDHDYSLAFSSLY